MTEIVGGGPFELAPGQWTDDTSMALCLAESLIETRGFDPMDQLRRYVRWFRQGHWSSTGECFDIGGTTRDALYHFEKCPEPFCGATHERSAGNGSLMRLAPVPLRYRTDPEKAMKLAGESSRTTHGARTAIEACQYFAGLLIGALEGVAKETLLSDHYAPVPEYWTHHPISREVDEIAGGSFTRKSPPDVKSSGYVVDTLQSALWRLQAVRILRMVAVWRSTSGGMLIPAALFTDRSPEHFMAREEYPNAGVPSSPIDRRSSKWRMIFIR